MKSLLLGSLVIILFISLMLMFMIYQKLLLICFVILSIALFRCFAYMIGEDIRKWWRE